MDEATRDPSSILIPREEWPVKFKQARMRIEHEEWVILAKELLDRNICKVLRKDQLIEHNGSCLLNGIFSVGKNKFIVDENSQSLEVLRLIINLVPSNEIQSSIDADVGALPVARRRDFRR